MGTTPAPLDHPYPSRGGELERGIVFSGKPICQRTKEVGNFKPFPTRKKRVGEGVQETGQGAGGRDDGSTTQRIDNAAFLSFIS